MSLMPIKTAPQCRSVMLVDADGAHTEATWMSARHEGEVVWEGWAYCDEILRDVCPEGPQDPQFWYDKPEELQLDINKKREDEIKHRIAAAVSRAIDNHEANESFRGTVDVPTPSDWRHWDARRLDYSDFPGTPAQAVRIFALFSEDRTARIIGSSRLNYAEMSTLSFSPDIYSETPCDDVAYVKSMLCPVVALDNGRNKTLIDPKGREGPLNGPII